MNNLKNCLLLLSCSCAVFGMADLVQLEKGLQTLQALSLGNVATLADGTVISLSDEIQNKYFSILEELEAGTSLPLEGFSLSIGEDLIPISEKDLKLIFTKQGAQYVERTSWSDLDLPELVRALMVADAMPIDEKVKDPMENSIAEQIVQVLTTDEYLNQFREQGGNFLKNIDINEVVAGKISMAMFRKYPGIAEAVEKRLEPRGFHRDAIFQFDQDRNRLVSGRIDHAGEQIVALFEDGMIRMNTISGLRNAQAWVDVGSVRRGMSSKIIRFSLDNTKFIVYMHDEEELFLFTTGVSPSVKKVERLPKIYAAALDLHGDFIVIVDTGGRLFLYDIKQGKLHSVQQLSDIYLVQLQMRGSEQMLIIAQQSRNTPFVVNMQLFEDTKLSVVRNIPMPIETIVTMQGTPNTLKSFYNKDKDLFAWADTSRFKIGIYDRATRKEYSESYGKGAPFSELLTFNQQGTHLVLFNKQQYYSPPGHVTVFNTDTGQKVANVNLYMYGDIFDIAFNVSNNLILFGNLSIVLVDIDEMLDLRKQYGEFWKSAQQFGFATIYAPLLLYLKFIKNIHLGASTEKMKAQRTRKPFSDSPLQKLVKEEDFHPLIKYLVS